MPPEERLKIVQEFADLTDDEAATVFNSGGVPLDTIDRMIENVVGTFELPLGIATNFQINGKDYLVPLAVEEPSVVAAASNSARQTRDRGGFQCSASEPVMIGQIQLTGVPDPSGARLRILHHRQEILDLANEQDPVLVRFGGGARDIDVRVVNSHVGDFVVTHLLVDTRDAMGANAVNTMAEAVAPYIEELTGGKVFLRILSNLAVHRTVRGRAIFSKEAMGGEHIVDGIIMAYALAASDPYRCATHNKGIMNGISSVVRSTGNDTRAVEAGAHAFAARTGSYLPLTTYEKNADGDLVGTIELPMPVGLIGGATKTHPVAKACIKILGVDNAQELGMIIAAVGLAQNHAALKALATVGIQKGHMKLHARNVAVAAFESLGVEEDPALIDEVKEELVKGGKIRVDKAEEILKRIKGL